jgi:hypothetical protein
MSDEQRVVLTLKKEAPDRLRFIERKTRYILQEKRVEMSGSLTVSVVWRDVPLVKL